MAHRKTRTFTEAEILRAARQVAKGKRVADVCRKLDISVSTFLRLRRRFGVKTLPRDRPAGAYSMNDLRRETGLSRRGVAVYIEQGLLMPAAGFGAGAQYGEEHLVRLRLRVLLKRAGIRKTEMRKFLSRLTPARERAIVQVAGKLAWGAPRVREWLTTLTKP